VEEDTDEDLQVMTNTKAVDDTNHHRHLDLETVEEDLLPQNHLHLQEKDLNLIEKILRIKKNLVLQKLEQIILVQANSKINNRIMMGKMNLRKIKKNHRQVDLNQNHRILDPNPDLHHQVLRKKIITKKTTEALANQEAKANNLLSLVEKLKHSLIDNKIFTHYC